MPRALSAGSSPSPTSIVTAPSRSLTVQVPQIPTRHEKSISTPIASAASSTDWFGSRDPVFPEVVNRICDAASGGDAPFPPLATTGDGLARGEAGVAGSAGEAASAGGA